MATLLQRTQKVLDISATERNTFKTCRRRWNLEVLENLEPEAPTTFDLEFGSGMHRALEDYYLTKSNVPAYPEAARPNPLKAALETWDEWYNETADTIEASTSLPKQTQSALLDQLVELGDVGEAILTGYHQYAVPIDTFTIHAVEGRQTGAGKSWLSKHWEDRAFLAEHSQNGVVWHEPSRRLLVPILHPREQRPLKNGAMLSMRIDLLVNDTNPGRKGIWIYDHKTTKSAPNEKGLDFDDQITACSYGVWRWLGIVPKGACFNYLIKKVPKEPRILKKGQLSTAKDQLTTAEQYRKSLEAQGLILKSGEITSTEHREAYEALLNRGWAPFFQRQYVMRNMAEIKSFEQHLYDEYLDMLDCYEGDQAMYPNFDRRWCPGCSVAPICIATEDGSDVQGIIESRYTQKPDRKAEFAAV